MLYADLNLVPDDAADALLVGLIAGTLIVLFILRWTKR